MTADEKQKKRADGRGVTAARCHDPEMSDSRAGADAMAPTSSGACPHDTGEVPASATRTRPASAVQNRKIRLDRPLLVEGRYDKNTLSQVAEGVILPVGGFSVFHNRTLVDYLRRLAEPDGLLILTDSDGGGEQIRRFLSSVFPKEKCIHLYIPQKEGKERRKKQRGKAGLLGVEGMPPELLRALLLPYDREGDAPPRPRLSLTKADLYALRLSGHPDSAAARAAVAVSLDLPADLTPDGFLQAVNTLVSPDDFAAALRAAGLPPLPERRTE